MNVVDSSAWLEYFSDGPNADFFTRPIALSAKLIVPSICLFEVFKRVKILENEDMAFMLSAYMQAGEVVPLSGGIALKAANLSLELKLPMADSIILATARHFDARLWTHDADFEGLEGVRYTPLTEPIRFC